MDNTISWIGIALYGFALVLLIVQRTRKRITNEQRLKALGILVVLPLSLFLIGTWADWTAPRKLGIGFSVVTIAYVLYCSRRNSAAS